MVTRMLAEKTNPASPPNWQTLCEPVQPFLDEVTGRLQSAVEAFDPEIATFVQYALASQGKHTPFEFSRSGFELPARVRTTLVAGHIAYEAE